MSFSTVGYCGPSLKQFTDDYLPLMRKMVTFDGKILVCKPDVKIVDEHGFLVDRRLANFIQDLHLDEINPVVFEYKAPTVEHPGDKEANEEILRLFIACKLVIDENFEFNKLRMTVRATRNDTDRCRPIILCHQLSSRQCKLLYIGFESGEGFYPMKPIQLPSSVNQDDAFIYAIGISTGEGLVVPLQPCYNHEIKDGIYYTENYTQDYTGDSKYWHGKNISVYRSGAIVLQLYSPKNGGPCILGKMFYNGQMQTKMIKEHHPLIYFIITSYNEGKQILRRYFHEDGMLNLYVECCGAIDHGKFCRNGDVTIEEATNDNDYLSGPFTVTYTKSKGSYTGSLRRDAKVREIPFYHLENRSRQEFVGQLIIDIPEGYQHFNYDSEGRQSGVQIERSYINNSRLSCDAPLKDLLRTSDGVITSKHYFIHGTEYSSTIYYAVLDNLRQAIASSTQLLPELVSMVMAYN